MAAAKSKSKLPPEVIEALERDPDRTTKGQWTKGVSGNPEGRPGTDRLRGLLQDYEQPMIKRLIDLALEGKDYVALKAIQVAWLYMYGKPRDSLDQDLMHTVEKVNALISDRSESSPKGTTPPSGKQPARKGRRGRPAETLQ